MSYALTSKYLYLHYSDYDENNQTINVLVYEIKNKFQLIDKITYTNTTADVFLLSCNNYLEKGSYFFVYDRVDNLLSLQKYQGYELVISVKDS